MWPSIYKMSRNLTFPERISSWSSKTYQLQSLFPPSESHSRVYDSVPSHCLWTSDDEARECLR